MSEAMTVVEKQKEERPREVRIVAHSMLFYWWPVWASASSWPA
jgi:hypothetical protein